MANVNRQIILAAMPVGLPKESDFRVAESPIPTPCDGEFLVRAIYVSIDPGLRLLMTGRPSYGPPLKAGEVMAGDVVGKVIRTHHPRFAEGTVVEGYLGWQEYAVTDGRDVRTVDPSIAPISTALGVLGNPGFTAYFGLLEIGHPQPGETVLVSAAAGVVGSVVGQIASVKGCRVVGVAGSEDKVRYITQELGFDDAFNYKTVADYVQKLKEVCPTGIDVYFDNVGGPLTDAVFWTMNLRARIAVCGQISQYNTEKPEMGPRLLFRLIEERARVQGFLVFDFAARYEEAYRQLADWLRAGKLKYRETITHGLENAPKAFIGSFKGQGIGKQLVKISDE